MRLYTMRLYGMRLYGPNYNNAMKMIRHDHPIVKCDIVPHLRCLQPFFSNNFTDR